MSIKPFVFSKHEVDHDHDVHPEYSIHSSPTMLRRMNCEMLKQARLTSLGQIHIGPVSSNVSGSNGSGYSKHATARHRVGRQLRIRPLGSLAHASRRLTVRRKR